MENILKELYPNHVKHLIENYTRILEASDYDTAIIYSGAEIYQYLDDMTYPFKTNPHFKYWVPLTNHPNSYIKFKLGQKPEIIYYKPVDFWHEVAGTPTGYWTSEFNIKEISTKSEAKAALGELSSAAYFGDEVASHKDWGFKAFNPKDVETEVHFIRGAKTKYEQACPREANRLGVISHQAAYHAFMNGASEYEINLAYLSAAGVQNDETPYGNIVALNESGAILHYKHPKNIRFSKENAHSFLLDAGISFNGYGSDITRTYSHKDDEFAQLVKAMDTAHLNILSGIKIGEANTTNHIKSHDEVAKVLSDFNFINLQADEIVEKKLVRPFYPHGVGHLLGLQVHDVGGSMLNGKGELAPAPASHPHLRSTRKLEEGFTFTIEPGLYFIQSLLDEVKATDNSQFMNWKKIESFMKYGGIRIEDNICLTKDGFDNYTRDAFDS